MQVTQSGKWTGPWKRADSPPHCVFAILRMDPFGNSKGLDAGEAVNYTSSIGSKRTVSLLFDGCCRLPGECAIASSLQLQHRTRARCSDRAQDGIAGLVLR